MFFKKKEIKWPRPVPLLTEEYLKISDDWMKYWFEINNKGKSAAILEFGHRYVVEHSGPHFLRTLEVGAGLGEHLKYEGLSDEKMENYVILELRQNMADVLKEQWPRVKVCVADCQEPINFPEGYFDRIIAIHVLEHLPNLPAFLAQAKRLLKKDTGVLLIVIPCEGGMGYWLGRKLFPQRIFEKRYHVPYKPLIQSEHLSKAHEIVSELLKKFKIVHKSYYPLNFPAIHLNLCLGLTLKPL